MNKFRVSFFNQSDDVELSCTIQGHDFYSALTGAMLELGGKLTSVETITSVDIQLIKKAQSCKD